jgi:tetratricopeptide (TPR) repeat protein/predicted Ser/Thr protein kinase
MTPEQYERIREVFLAAREKGPHQRAQFLDRACGDDDRLRAEVERLLANDDEADTFLQTPALGENFAKAHPESLLPKADSAPAGGSSASVGIDRTPFGAYPERIGQYRILGVLGEGGMGIVYRAEQESPRRTVALKVIKAGAESRALLKRFEHEGQVLGWLQHPGIAQIFEAGTADTGQGLQPFFAMEFVRGQSLIRYAAAQKLGLSQRLELIAKVCDAVHHAHQKGVIHRDLKPGNILVDDSGQPKVLDFGVARVTDADIRTTTLQTDVGQLVGTIAYMSPEQVAGDSRQLDTRSDVYALGVILYELLAGRVPFDVSRQTIPQAARMITEEEPTSLSSINRIFRGDIETIVAKALEKDKNRRYQSAAGLAADIRRCLSDEPISARPASAVYQLRKFARRNKALVGGVVATFVVLLIGIAGTSHGLLQATAQRRAAESERNRALAAERTAEERREEVERQSAIAQAVNEFLNRDLLAAASPENLGPDVSVGQLLDHASEGLEDRFQDQPLVEAAIRSTLGETYVGLGDYEAAALHCEKALKLRRAELGEDDSKTLSSMSDLGVVYERQERWDEAERLHLGALEGRRRLLGADHADTLMSMSNLGTLYFRRGRYDEAEPLLVEALEQTRRALGDKHPSTLNPMNNLANVYAEQGRYDEAEPLMLNTLELKRQVLGEEHPKTLVSVNNLATLYFRQRRYEDAEPLYAKTLEVRRRVLGAEHPRTLMSVIGLGGCYGMQGRYAEAEALLVETLASQRSRLGDEHSQTAHAMALLGRLYAKQGRYDEAEPLYIKALEVRRATLGEKHPYTLWSIDHLAALYKDQDRYDAAEPLARELVALRRERAESKPSDLAGALGLLAEVLIQRSDAQSAEPLLRECLEIRRTGLPEDDRSIAETESLLGGCLTALGRYDEAEPLLLESYPRIRSAAEEPDKQARAACQRIIELYDAWGKPDQAAEWRAQLEQYRATTQPAMLRPGSGPADRAGEENRLGPTGP